MEARAAEGRVEARAAVGRREAVIGGEEGGGEGGGGEGGGGEGGDDGGGGGDGGGDGGSDGGGGEGGGCDGGGDGDGGEEGGGDDGAPPLQCKPSSLFPSPRRSVAVCWLVRVSTTSTRPGSPSPLPPRAPHHVASRQRRRCTSAASRSRRRQTLPSQDHGLIGLPRQQGRLTGASTVHRRSSGQRSGLPATSLRRAHVCRRGLQLDLGRRALIHVGLLSPCEERTEPSSWRVEGSGSQPWGSGSGG